MTSPLATPAEVAMGVFESSRYSAMSRSPSAWVNRASMRTFVCAPTSKVYQSSS
jgi:hypothetical protein